MGMTRELMSERKSTLVTNLLLIRNVYGFNLNEMAASCGVSVPTMRLIMRDPERMTIRQVDGLARLAGLDTIAILSKPIIGAGK